MSDVLCPFCGAEGWVVENHMAEFQNADGSVSPMYGIQFTEHIGKCPLGLIKVYRADYHSVLEAVDAYKMEFCPKESSEFASRLRTFEDGRYAKIVDACGFEDSCEKCYYFNPNITDPGQAYRCFGGDCPGAVLSLSMRRALWRLLGWMSDDRADQKSDEVCPRCGGTHNNG